TGSGFTLSWNNATDNVGVTGYDVYKDDVLVISTTETSALISNLTGETTYSMTVKAKDAAGNVSAASNAIRVKTLVTAITTVEAQPLLIYPNPATNYFNIELSEKSTVQILSLSGSVLVSEAGKEGVNTIQFNLGPGLYMVKVTGENNNIRISKIIVK
ncbi:MAG TPA: T9SS type A sorting domain-containing protein, partial [Bacteroidales bacterium]